MMIQARTKVVPRLAIPRTSTRLDRDWSKQPCLSGCLPLRLQRRRRTGWVNPGALVDSGIGRPGILHSNF